jgi:predicted amidophosphoribosyltransferase
MEVRLDQILLKPSDFKICKECGRVLFYDRECCIWCGCEEFDEDRTSVLDFYEKEVKWWKNESSIEDGEISQQEIDAIKYQV